MLSAGECAGEHGAAQLLESGVVVVVLDPVLRLVERAVAVAGEMLVEEVAVGLLGVLHDLMPAHAIDIHVHKAPVQRG